MRERDSGIKNKKKNLVADDIKCCGLYNGGGSGIYRLMHSADLRETLSNRNNDDDEQQERNINTCHCYIFFCSILTNHKSHGNNVCVYVCLCGSGSLKKLFIFQSNFFFEIQLSVLYYSFVCIVFMYVT